MGLLDGIVGQVMDSVGGGSNAAGAGLLQAVGALINQHPGGLAGLIAEFERKGLGSVAASWVGKGTNLPISAEQLQSVLGPAQLGAVASSLGFSPEQASSQLSQLLPHVVDHLTPNGSLPDHGALGALLGSLGR